MDRRSTCADVILTITVQTCEGDGEYIVIIRSATQPETDDQVILKRTGSAPGARYFRTADSCRSLRAATDEGNAIYAVYLRPYGTADAACANRCDASSYVKRLSDTGNQIKCS